MNKYDFITVGGAIKDISLFTDEGVLINNKKDILKQELLGFEYGAKIRVDKVFTGLGGGAANAAVCLSKLGFKVGCLTSVGADARGREILNNFKNNKVDTKLIQTHKTELTGFTFLLVGKGSEHVAFSHEAAKKYLKISERDKKEIKRSSMVYIASLSGTWKTQLSHIFSTGPDIAWNPGGRQLAEGWKTLGKFIKKTKIFLLNQDEAIELVISKKEYQHKTNQYLNDTKNLLKIIKDWGPEIVVVTRGKKGADAYDGNNFYHQDILKEKKRIDTTGMGDSFNSTFVAGLKIFKGDIQKSMRLGVTNTASIIGEQGAQNGLLSKSEILKKVK